MEQLHYEVIRRREVEFKVGVLAIVLNKSLTMMKWKGFQIVLVVFVGTNHYSFWFDIVSDNYAKFSCEILCRIKIFW